MGKSEKYLDKVEGFLKKKKAEDDEFFAQDFAEAQFAAYELGEINDEGTEHDLIIALTSACASASFPFS